MNIGPRRRNVLQAFVVLSITLLLCPPFRFIGGSGVETNLGYGFLFAPPAVSETISAAVNVPMLLIELAVLMACCAAAFLLTTERPIPVVDTWGRSATPYLESDRPPYVEPPDIVPLWKRPAGAWTTRLIAVPFLLVVFFALYKMMSDEDGARRLVLIVALVAIALSILRLWRGTKPRI